MIKINKEDYKNFYSIFKELGSYVFMLSSIDGIVGGELYADDSNNPTYAVMLTADLNYLAGDLTNKKFEKELFKLSQSDNFLDYTGFVFLSKNISSVANIFGEHTHKFIKRYNHELMKSDFHYYRTILNGEKLIKMTPDNISIFSGYVNFKDVYEECNFYWDEYHKDSKIKFAFALVKENTFLSYSYVCGESLSENSCELAIETFECFRRKGYAELLSRETLKELIQLGYDKFSWHCHFDNIASSKTALKLGYIKVEETHLAWFKKNLEE